MTIKSRRLVIPVILAIATVVMVPIALHPAEAHTAKTFGNITVKIGWVKEPPLVGDTNGIQLFIYNGTDDNAPPIADTGLDNMTVTIQYGGQSKDLDFDASDDTPGEYDSAIIPTQPGTYTVIIKGSIDGTTIPATPYTFEQVESKDKYNFP